MVVAIPVYGRESVSDDDTCTPLPGSVQCVLDNFLTLCVQSGRGFVQEENLWVSHQGAGDADALLLSTTQLGAL